VLYAGTVGMSQGVGTLMDAAELLTDDAGIEIVIAGDGAEGPELRSRLARGGLGNVRMLGRVPHERVPELYAEADAAVVLLRDKPLFEGALPTKMFEAMSAGRPLVLSAAGEAATLVRDASCGVVVPPERPRELAGALSDLAGDRERAGELGAAGRRAVVEHYSRAEAVDRWYELLTRVAS
jgi:glycosyltransferase involved in cell wall biosynthesis